MAFPTTLDDLTTNNDITDGTSVVQASDIDTLNVAVDALQTKVGIDNSAVTTSHDYLINGGHTPHDWTGGESVTLPNGLIIKQGTGTFSSGLATVTFGSAFPTAIITVIATAKHSTNQSAAVSNTYNQAVGSFQISATTSTGIQFDWIAIGY